MLESAVRVEMWITIVIVPGVLLDNWALLFSETGPSRCVKKNAFIYEKKSSNSHSRSHLKMRI